MGLEKRSAHVRWHVALPSGITRLQAGHGSVFGSGGTGAFHAWNATDGSLRFSRGEPGAACEGFALFGDTLLVVTAKAKHGEVWSKTAFAFEATTGAEHGRTELQLDGPVGRLCVAATEDRAFLSLVGSSEILGVDAQANEVALLALETGRAVTSLVGAGELVVAVVGPQQGLRGYLPDETLALEIDNALPLDWNRDGLLAMVGAEVRCVDPRGVERWRRPFDPSSRMSLAGPVVIAVDHLGMVHALESKTGEARWATSSGAKKAIALNPVVCDGYVWVLNALGKLVAFDLTEGRKAFAPNETYPHCHGLLATGHSVFVHSEVDGQNSLTAFEVG
ncbi:MAG TPA: PQQ-binding-like beta-propeller repeat protein [Myxococcales bacterium]